MGLLAGRAADALVVLLKHFRRVNSSAAAWTRFCTKLDEEQVKRMEKLGNKWQVSLRRET